MISKDILIQFSNDKLCEIIVSHRYLGIMKDEAIVCMEELVARREDGSQFIFEDKISELLATLPKIEKDLHSIFKFSLNKLKL